jgi:tRNA(Arg) A34 adenosine deaminase TadA
MTKEKIREFGIRELTKIDPKNEGVGKFKTQLMDYQFNNQYADDRYVWLTDVLALKAIDLGNFGIGCILIDINSNVVVQGHNEVFNPYFRSDRHAEMVVMDKFEDTYREFTRLEDYTLYTSLESCPMCLTRMILSGVNKVLYAAPDIESGMVHRIKDLPKFWIEFGDRQGFFQADCSQGLINIATEIFLFNVDELNEKLKNRKALK